uniref:Putative salivary lipocalin n=1 Tax=Panstrongylus lignarius TaxID=156445 RepID=A0A224XWE6_9HEMI
MKMIITITFLGVLMQAFAEECKLMKAADNFDSEKYFSVGHVYVTHSRDGPNTDVCREYKTTKNNDGTSNTVLISDYKKGRR